MRLPQQQRLGHTAHVHQGMAIGSVQSSAAGLSWLVEEQHWDQPPQTHFGGGLSMDPVTFQRLINFLRTSSHTGMGHAKPALAQEVDGINALARESAYDQAGSEVIGPRHPLFSLEGY
jgi:hypothetical protein